LSTMAQEAIAEALDVADLPPHLWLSRMAAKTLQGHSTTPILNDCRNRPAKNS
jgi:hypothetical protein